MSLAICAQQTIMPHSQPLTTCLLFEGRGLSVICNCNVHAQSYK